jgi:BON domain-containing protein
MRNVMKYRVVHFSGIVFFLAVLGWAGPAPAQTEDLEFCVGHGYTHYVRDLIIDISNLDGVPDDFKLATVLNGESRTIRVKRKAGDTDGWWRGQAPRSFIKLQKIDLQPQIPGFIVSGPESCQYQKDGRECVALYSFSVQKMKVTLRADSPEVAIRLTPGAGSIPSLDAQCVPPGPPGEAELAARVRAALKKDETLDSFVIEVTARGKDVYLSGLVNSEIAKKKAETKATAEGANVKENNLQVVELYDGTALLDVDLQKPVTITVKAGEVLFSAMVEVPKDLLKRSEWIVSRDMLQKANDRQFARSKETARGRTAGFLQKTLPSLGNLQSITIQRSDW